MRTPSWVELAGRNMAAGALAMSGSLQVHREHPQTQTIDERFDFWHGGGGLWRIESDGQVLYIAAGDGASLVFIDGEMRRRSTVNSVVAQMGSVFNPFLLLGEQSVLSKISESLRVAGAIEPVELDGRSAWRVPFVSPQGDIQVELVFDEETGLLVRLHHPMGGVLIKVTALSVHDEIPRERFIWDGPVGDTALNLRGPRAATAERMAQLVALVEASKRPIEVLQAVSRAADHGEAISAVMKLLDTSETGAEVVLNAQIRRFSGREIQRMQHELAEVRDVFAEFPEE
ncbi:hypothetical protein IEU95_08390 [Hoyosella rhizosphaerae]|uniref:Uncharacterized protein n=1 Tax=Hoyosella rhizosphaerae TaxID=1755582 RepID=A0A916U1B5_9ACTN|nr:hypothetical protein [Hoyosella rhizosphaerae]MBN4926846.1 hypothetical protein [Hoyosella rhizosphaerae]GGC56058.1 hypothetical protein GCM10011410_05580 [Hoyosella rhizosphaerae]